MIFNLKLLHIYYRILLKTFLALLLIWCSTQPATAQQVHYNNYLSVIPIGFFYRTFHKSVEYTRHFGTAYNRRIQSGFHYGQQLYIPDRNEHTYYLVTAAFNATVVQANRFEYAVGVHSGAERFQDTYTARYPYREDISYGISIGMNNNFYWHISKRFFPGANAVPPMPVFIFDKGLKTGIGFKSLQAGIKP